MKVNTINLLVVAQLITLSLIANLTHAAEQLPTTAVTDIEICINFGCTEKQRFTITDQEWKEISHWFKPVAKSPKQERRQIQHAIGWFEEIAGRYTPIHRDKQQNYIDPEEEFGQLDCIAESKNTDAFLRFLEQYGLFSHHRVVKRLRRYTAWDQHWTGQVEEIESNTRYVIDSWFHDNGMLPYVQESNQWKDIPFFFTSYADNAPEY